jgi:hypothetical protein
MPSGLFEFINANQTSILIGVALVGIYIIYEFFWKSGEKKPPQPLDRREVERKNFIERMKLNTPVYYRWFLKSSDIIGKIISMKDTIIEGNPEKHEVIEMVVQPALLSRFKIANPLSKKMCIMMDKKNTDFEKIAFTNELSITDRVTFDNVHGIFYDRSLETELAEHIKNDNIFRTDLEQMAGIYYVHSQEQSTFGENNAHEMAMKEKELQIELARKRGKQTSI